MKVTSWGLLLGFLALCLGVGIVGRLSRGNPPGPQEGPVPIDGVRIRLAGPSIHRAEADTERTQYHPDTKKKVESAYRKRVNEVGRRPHILNEGPGHIEFTFPSEADWEEWDKQQKGQK